MAFALLIIGIILIVSAIRNSASQLWTVLVGDFSGPGNFIYWIIALIIIGMVGYVKKLKALSDGLLVLIILALFLSKGNTSQPGGGFFKQLMSALGTTNTKQAPSIAGSSTGSTVTVGGSNSLIGGSSSTGAGTINIGINSGGIPQPGSVPGMGSIPWYDSWATPGWNEPGLGGGPITGGNTGGTDFWST